MVGNILFLLDGKYLMITKARLLSEGGGVLSDYQVLMSLTRFPTNVHTSGADIGQRQEVLELIAIE